MLQEPENEAIKIGVNAFVGVDLDHEFVGQGGSMLMFTVSKTAAVVN